jgi:hypothetical protein
MAGLSTVISGSLHSFYQRLVSLLALAGLACALLTSPPAQTQTEDLEPQLQALTAEREMLSKELEQFTSTVRILHQDDSSPEQSSNPAVRKLALEMVRIKERLITVTEQEVTLLQEQIARARSLTRAAGKVTAADPADNNGTAARAIESKPMRVEARDYSLAKEEENVKRLHSLLANYYTELQESARTLPSEEELTRRVAAQVEADKLAKIPFSADKVHLNGAEGSTALSQITQRLTDPNIPESRRDVAPICGIRTRLFGSLIASENRSLRPVGKNHFVARVRLQPGDTTLKIKGNRWEVQLPQHLSASDFLITLYTPPGSAPALHLFAIAELLAEDKPHIPAWLPDEIKLASKSE